MGNLNCGISQKRLIVERNGQKFGNRGTTVYICRVLFMPDSLSLVWGHSVHFAKFPIPWFSKHYSFHSFLQISTKLRTKYHNHMQGLIFGHLPKIKILWHCELFLNTGPYRVGKFKTLFLLQFWSDVSQTLWGHWAIMANYGLSLFVAISQV